MRCINRKANSFSSSEAEIQSSKRDTLPSVPFKRQHNDRKYDLFRFHIDSLADSRSNERYFLASVFIPIENRKSRCDFGFAGPP